MLITTMLEVFISVPIQIVVLHMIPKEVRRRSSLVANASGALDMALHTFCCAQRAYRTT